MKSVGIYISLWLIDSETIQPIVMETGIYMYFWMKKMENQPDITATVTQ